MSEVSTTTQYITALAFDITQAEQQLDMLATKINQITQQIASKNWSIKDMMQGTGEYGRLRSELETLNKKYQQAQQEVQKLKKEMQALTTQGTAYTSTLATAIESKLVNALRNVAKKAASTVKTVESAMVDISRVMQLTANETENLRGSLFDLGNEYGRSFDDVSDISLRFAQAGYNMSDTISLTEDALLALNTAELNSEEATQSLIGILSQWGYEASDLITIIDKLNYTADNNAVTTQDLIDGLLKASSMARTAGMSFDDTVGILTSMKVASGAAGKEVGNAFKSIMAYIQRPESLKLFDNMGINVFADKVTGELLPMMDILENMSAKWNENQEGMLNTLVASGDALQMMSEEWAIATDSIDEYTAYQEAAAEATDKANTAEARAQAQAAAGVYRRNYYISLMENLAQAQQVSNDLMNAEGHSAAENARYMETLAAKIEQLVVSLKELAVTAADAGMLDLAKSAIDTATAFTQWTTNTKTLIPLLGSLAGIMITIKQQKLATELTAIGHSFKNAGNTIKETVTGLKTTTTTTQGTTTAVNGLAGAIGTVGLAFSAISAAISLANIAISKWHEKNEEAIATGEEVANSLDTLSQKYDEYATLSGVLERTSSQEETYKQLNEEIIELLGDRAEALKGLKEGTAEYNAELENLIIQERINSQGDYADATKSAKKEMGFDYAARTNSYYNRNDTVSQFLLNEGLLTESNQSQGLEINTNENGVLGYYASLKSAKEALNEETARLITANNEEAAQAIKDSPIYNQISENYDKISESVENYVKALVAEAENNYIIQNGLPKTYAEQVKMNDVIYIRTGLTEDYRDTVNSLVGTYYTATDAERDFINALNSSDYNMPVEQLKAMAASGELNTTVFGQMLESNKGFATSMKSFGISTGEAVTYLNQLYGSSDDAADGLSNLGDEVGMTENELKELSKAIESAESSISTLNGYIQTLSEGNGLTAEQVLELVDTYGLLLDQFTLTENGYKIEISALEQLREAQVQAAISARNSQIEQTQVLQTGLLDRIKAYGLEINSIASLAEAQAALLAVEQQRNKTAESINSAADAEYYKGQLSDMDAIVDTLKDIAENYANTEDLAQGFYSTLGKSFEETKKSSKETVDILKEITEGYEHLVSLGIYSTEEQIAYYENLRRTLSLTEEQYQSLESTLHKLYQTQLEESKEAIEAEYKAHKEAIEEQYKLDKENREEYWDDELDKLKDNLNAQIDSAKKAYEQKKKLADKSYDNQKAALESLRDAEIENINAAYNAQIEALEKIKAARQAERDEDDYQNERAELLEQISYYEQRTGTEAVEQLADLRKQLANLDRERQRELEDEEIDAQIDSLESQRDDAASAAKKQYAAQIAALEDSQEIELEMYEATYEREIELLENRLEKETEALEKKRDEDLKRLEDEKEAAIKAADDKWAAIEAIFEDRNLAMIASAGMFAPQLYDQFHELFTEKFKMDLDELSSLMGELEGKSGSFSLSSGTKPTSTISKSVSSKVKNTEEMSSGGFSVGTQVKVSGTVYGDSYGDNPGANFDSKKTTITRVNSSGSKPYHVGNLGWVDESQLVKARTGGKTTADGLAMLHKDELIINPPVTKMLEDLVKVLNPQVTKADIAAQQDAFCRYWGKEFNDSQRAMYQNVSNNNTYNNSNSNTDNHSKQTINNININGPLQNIEHVEDNADMTAAVNALERKWDREIASKL